MEKGEQPQNPNPNSNSYYDPNSNPNSDTNITPSPNPNLKLLSSESHRVFRKIENSAQRQVTFCKRRTSLLKKGYELSILCDAKVAIIVFSPSGKLSQFCSPSTSMLEMFERYKRSKPENNVQNNLQQEAEYWRLQTIRLREEVEYLKNLHCQTMGEDNSTLSIEEIENLESILSASQRKLRTRKVELLQMQTQSAQMKGDALSSENKLLKAKLRGVIEEECTTNSISNVSCCEHNVDTKLAL